jgi:hypothetical protein
VLDAEQFETDRQTPVVSGYAGSSPAGSDASLAPASAAGSEGIDGGSGAVAGAAGSLAAEESEPPRSHCISLLSMRAMLQGPSAAR